MQTTKCGGLHKAKVPSEIRAIQPEIIKIAQNKAKWVLEGVGMLPRAMHVRLATKGDGPSRSTVRDWSGRFWAVLGLYARFRPLSVHSRPRSKGVPHLSVAGTEVGERMLPGSKPGFEKATTGITCLDFGAQGELRATTRDRAKAGLCCACRCCLLLARDIGPG